MSENVEIKNNFFRVSASDFSKIPGSPIAYWVLQRFFKVFSVNSFLGNFAEVKSGLSTGDNDLFLRLWNEVSIQNIRIKYMISNTNNELRWIPYLKGGGNRKWYGNNTTILNWGANGELLKHYGKAVFRNSDYYQKSGITWSGMATNNVSFRYTQNGFIFDSNKGPMIFCPNGKTLEIIGLLNTRICNYMQKTINPTLSTQISDIEKTPLPKESLSHNQIRIVRINISISKSDWDLRETSLDFLRSPLITDYSAEIVETVIDDNLTDISWSSSRGKALSISDSYTSFTEFWKEQFIILHKNEEELNRIFINLYELQDELTPDVPYNEITILQSELEPKALKENKLVFKKDEILRQFVSYGVGCIFGRYSLDKDGLILANAGEGLEDYMKQIPEPTLTPDKSGILPITEEDDFIDDITNQFKAFLKVSFGSEKFTENLHFVEEAIGKDVRSYFIKDFYKDHVKRYKTRPIYWMISSPSGAFRALIYLHRYTKDTIGVFLNDYLRRYMKKLELKIKVAEQTIISGSASSSDKTTAQKNIDKFHKVLKELEIWERDVVYPLAVKRVELDLDDGVKVNYGKLGDVLEKVKGLNG